MDYDVVIIGAGPGGYVAAIKASHLGLKAAIIEKDQMGGTCLLRGCIPTKTLIAHAAVVSTIEKASNFGVDVASFTIDYKKMKENKDGVVKELTTGIEALLKAAKVDIFYGSGSFIDSHTLKITGKETKHITTKNTIIATGSEPSTLPFAKVDEKVIHDSTSILELTEIPKSLTVLGGGYIGCEFASLFHALGTKVTIVEMFDGLVLTQGKTISDALTKKFADKGMHLQLGKKVENVELKEGGVSTQLEGNEQIFSDMLLVSTGRRPYSNGLHLENIGLGADKRGFLEINEHLQTPIPHVYAIGDITGKSMLAHTASYQGILAAENIAGKEKAADYSCIPAVIFTDPEISSVGLSQEMAKEKNITFKTARFPFNALGKAKAMQKEDGFVEILYGEKHKEVLGAIAVGYNASVLIAEITLAMNNELTLESIAETIHAHPTMSESWAEASEVGLGHPIHLPKRK